jgi:hypothetical protein
VALKWSEMLLAVLIRECTQSFLPKIRISTQFENTPRECTLPSARSGVPAFTPKRCVSLSPLVLALRCATRCDYVCIQGVDVITWAGRRWPSSFGGEIVPSFHQ